MARTAWRPSIQRVKRGTALPRARYYLNQTPTAHIGSRKSPAFDPMRQILVRRVNEGRA